MMIRKRIAKKLSKHDVYRLKIKLTLNRVSYAQYSPILLKGKNDEEGD